MKRCPICAELIDEQSTVCPFCGEQLQTAPPPVPPATVADTQPSQKSCPICGEMIDAHLSVCPICGENIGAPQSVVEPQTEPVAAPRPEREPEPVAPTRPEREPERVAASRPELEPEPVVPPRPERKPEPVPEPEPEVKSAGSAIPPINPTPRSSYHDEPPRKNNSLKYILGLLAFLLIAGVGALCYLLFFKGDKQDGPDKEAAAQQVNPPAPSSAARTMSTEEMLDSVANELAEEVGLVAICSSILPPPMRQSH